jgi:hypothetical protein
VIAMRAPSRDYWFWIRRAQLSGVNAAINVRRYTGNALFNLADDAYDPAGCARC